MSKPVINLLLDSGAFSAWSLGREVSLPNYISFVKENPESIAHTINLDVIIPENPEKAAEAGRVNFLEMRNAGVDCIPVHHARESFKWLELMCDDCKYIGVSGTSLVSPLEVFYYYDMVFQYITDSHGFPVVDTHLFGDTSPKSLMNYCATSADSATWMIQAGRAARINLDGKSIQFRSTKRRDTSYIEIEDTGPKRQSWEEAFVRLGIDPDKAMTVKATQSEQAMIRAYMVLAELLQLQKRSAHVTKFTKGKSLVNSKRQLEGGRERQGPIAVYAVLSPSAYYFNLPIVATLGLKNVLCSYYYLADAPAKFWPERLMPFLYNPMEYCETNPKVRRYLDKLREVLLPKPDPINMPVNPVCLAAGAQTIIS